MADVRIRQAQEPDQIAIMSCVQAAYSKYLARMEKEPAPLHTDYATLIAQGVVYVLVGEEGVRGVLVMTPQVDNMFVENVAVDPRYQGQGFGKLLMAFVDEQAQKQHLNAIRLYTNEMMTESLRFYQRLGFEEEARREDEGYHRVFLRKSLG